MQFGPELNRPVEEEQQRSQEQRNRQRPAWETILEELNPVDVPSPAPRPPVQSPVPTPEREPASHGPSARVIAAMIGGVVGSIVLLLVVLSGTGKGTSARGAVGGYLQSPYRSADPQGNSLGPDHLKRLERLERNQDRALSSH